MSSAEIDELSLALGQEVRVDQIDKSLRQLWATDESRTNACLINFAIYSEQSGSLQKNSTIVGKLMHEHACRALLIEMDRSNTEASIRSWIMAHCYLSGGRKSVCCEQIAFRLTGVSRGRLRNTVFAHLASDLPFIFWWQGNLSPMFEDHLHAVVDRFIFDSDEWTDPANGFSSIARASQKKTSKMIIQDLAWTRSFPYRTALASLFDDPMAMPAFAAVNDVEIIYHPSYRMAALQLLAWLQVQSTWNTGLELQRSASRSENGNEIFHFLNAKGQAITAKLTADANSAPLGGLHLRGDDVCFLVRRTAGHCHLQLHSQIGEHHVETLQPISCDESCSLIGEQLARGGKNSLYRKILPAFMELL